MWPAVGVFANPWSAAPLPADLFPPNGKMLGGTNFVTKAELHLPNCQTTKVSSNTRHNGRRAPTVMRLGRGLAGGGAGRGGANGGAAGEPCHPAPLHHPVLGAPPEPKWPAGKWQ